jgi:hypothetical protein
MVSECGIKLSFCGKQMNQRYEKHGEKINRKDEGHLQASDHGAEPAS